MNLENGLKALLYLGVGMLTTVFVTAWCSESVARILGMESGVQFHLTFASVAVLCVLFSDTCVLFYFIGTAVWMRDRSHEILVRGGRAPSDGGTKASAGSRAQATEAYDLYQKANKLKARTFPFATMGIGLALFTFVLGGAGQVGAIPRWLHPTLASLLLLNEIGGLRFYLKAMKTNVSFLDRVSTLLEHSDGVPANSGNPA